MKFIPCHGFTLVELSIVLMIIGILIGGILVGQSMINSAKVTNVIRQLQQYDTAVSNFQTEYNSLPGDSTAFGCANSGGGSICNNGLIEGYSGVNYGNFSFDFETANFWLELQQGGFYNSKPFSAAIPVGGFNTDIHLPNVPIMNASIPGEIVAAYCNMPRNGNCWELADWRGTTGLGGLAGGAGGVKAIFTTEMALALDAKIDDGNARTGFVQNWYGQYQVGGTGYGYDNCDFYSDNYLLQHSGTICLISIGMLSQVGQIQ